MANRKNVIESFSDFMDQNIKGVQYGLYSTALVGLAVALRSVRPFKKFTTPQSLPATFVKKHMKLRGRVVGIVAPGYLQVDHYPIFSVWQRKSEPLLVGVESVKVMGHGMSWLQTVVSGQDVTFTPIAADEKILSCIVTRSRKNVGVQLVSLGMGTVTPIRLNLQNDILYKQYYAGLLEAENKAEKKRLGVWADSPPPPSIVIRTALKTVDVAQKAADIIQKGFSRFKFVPSKSVQ